jgi:cytochrome c-type biogenesis protein CcmH/NrfG
MAAYCGAILLLGLLYAGFGNSIMGNSELTVLQKIAQRRIDAEPNNMQMHFLLANISFEKKDYGLAVKEYQAALRLAPDNAEIMNNLAWLYATVQDAQWKNPPEALKLSRMAAELDPKPHILDTLAESYFQNGDFRSALVVINMAIAQNPPDRAYYEQQRAKFQQHLNAAAEDDSASDVKTPQNMHGISI